MITVDRLTKRYGAFTAVRELSFAVAAGEVLGLVGPNGAGKTTTLSCLAGIVIPSGGEITIAGAPMGRDPVTAKRAMSFVPDEPQLFEYLTVDEHLRFVARLYGVRDAEARITPLLEEVELGAKRDALPGELSRGMRQKLATACALLHDPQALLLDEPLTGLDPVGIRRMKSTIADRARGGTAVVLSSHLLHLVEELCTRVLVLRGGEPVALGTLDEIAASRPDVAAGGLEELFLALTAEPDRPGEPRAGADAAPFGGGRPTPRR